MYDYSGARIANSKNTGSSFEQTNFLIDNSNLTGYSQTLLEIDYSTGEIEKRYEFGDDLLAEIASPESPAPSPLYFLCDALGSTRSLTNNNGTITESYNYKPFGSALDFNPSSSNTSQLFTGESFDTETSLYYLRARQYDPSTGRFTSHDPVEDPANKLHKYLYCGNDGVNCVDLSGKIVDFTLPNITITAALVSILAGIAVGTMSGYVTYRETGNVGAGFKAGLISGLLAAFSTFLIVKFPGVFARRQVSMVYDILMAAFEYYLYARIIFNKQVTLFGLIVTMIAAGIVSVGSAILFGGYFSRFKFKKPAWITNRYIAFLDYLSGAKLMMSKTMRREVNLNVMGILYGLEELASALVESVFIASTYETTDNTFKYLLEACASVVRAYNPEVAENLKSLSQQINLFYRSEIQDE